MKKFAVFLLFWLICYNVFAQFAPPAGQIGTTAIHKDSSAFVSWATGCTITRGYQDNSNTGLGFATVGDCSMALGIAGSNGIVSLGEGGSAILTFANPIKNEKGWDFAVFENSFNDTYLELAFVEVSSDGINFYRFPSTSNTQDTVQVGSFGALDATQINNLAGKYRALFGTPFDLEELTGQIGLDVNNITHVKIIDVVGSIQNGFATYDSNGNKINDPWNTPFSSSGFDLDAIGVINQATSNVQNCSPPFTNCKVYPNPVNENSVLKYYLEMPLNVKIEITDLFGRETFVITESQQDKGWQTVPLNKMNLKSGIYFVQLISNQGKTAVKIIVNNEN